MKRVKSEAIWLTCPNFTDVLIWDEAFQRLEALPGIVGIDEVCEVALELSMILIMEAFDSCFLYGPVHAFDLPVGPVMLRFGQAVFDIVPLTGPVKGMPPPPCRRSLTVPRQIRKLNAIVGQDGMDPVGDHLCQRIRKAGGRHRIGAFFQPGKGKLTGTVYRNINVRDQTPRLSISLFSKFRVGFIPQGFPKLGRTKQNFQQPLANIF